MADGGMRQPAKLGAAGKKAWQRALRAIEEAEDQDRLYDLAARYAYAVDLADKARREWREAGEPMVFDCGNGASTVHPLIKVIENGEKEAHRFGEALGIKAPTKRKHRGPDPKAVVQADIGPSPAQKLRAVK